MSNWIVKVTDQAGVLSQLRSVGLALPKRRASPRRLDYNDNQSRMHPVGLSVSIVGW